MASCANDATIRGARAGWRATLPNAATRTAGGASWQPAAHAILALARVAPADARGDLFRFARNPIPEVRTYTARAAALLGDTATLRMLASDKDDNVAEAAIAGLVRASAHGDDDTYVTALTSGRKPVVRAAAVALKGSSRGPAVVTAAIAAAERLRRDSSETSRRVRAAVAERVAEFATAADWPRIAPLTTDFDCAIARAYATVGTKLGVVDAAPHCAPMPVALPPDAVRLALGAPVMLRVTMTAASGGGSFTVRLRGDNAPVMAARVLQLVKAHWYDGNDWHRVEPDFVTQGGAPGANEFHGHPRFMRDELGIIPHARGTIGMSTGEHDTGDGQWFFNLRDNLRLNRDYTVFAEVTQGIEVVDGILEGDRIAKIEVIAR
jgi:cyclophilin family peptidyl-prolyl cis-trans isomerase